jgi:Arm DNA-binding domain/Phage integrase, N-terminal SAM-like domain
MMYGRIRLDKFIWDTKVAGFGARRQKGTAVSYVLFYRTKEGRQRWHTIGRHGAPWTPDSARNEARRVLGEVASGDDPAGEKTQGRRAATVAELCDLYIVDTESGRLLTKRGESKKPSTFATDKGRIERHIKPLLGALKVAAVTRNDIEGFLHDVAAGKTAVRIKTKKRGVGNVRGGRGTATRTTGLLSAIFSYAVRARMRTDNPVHGVTLFAVMLRRLSKAASVPAPMHAQHARDNARRAALPQNVIDFFEAAKAVRENLSAKERW